MSALELVEQIISRVKINGDSRIVARMPDGTEYEIRAAMVADNPGSSVHRIVLLPARKPPQ